jgi:thiol-disulfide isomerase/thioredoxin
VRRGVRAAAVGLVLVAALVLAEVLSGSGDAKAHPAPPLPTRVLTPPAQTVAGLAGKPAIVHFWASWCGPCTKEAPELARLARELHGRATLVGVDYTDSRSGAKAFLAEHGWRFPVLVDANGDAGDAYGINGLPSTFVLDRKGRVVKRLTGGQTAAGLLAAIRGL